MEKYIYGSSAYKIEDYAYDEVSDRQKQEEAKTEKQIRKEDLYRRFIRSMCLYGFIVFLLGAGTVYSRVLVMQAESNVAQKEAALAEIMEANNNKKIRFEQSIDLKKIEELAITKYGMQRPDNNQTIYVNVVQSDYGEVIKPQKSGNKMIVKAD